MKRGSSRQVLLTQCPWFIHHQLVWPPLWKQKFLTVCWSGTFTPTRLPIVARKGSLIDQSALISLTRSKKCEEHTDLSVRSAFARDVKPEMTQLLCRPKPRTRCRQSLLSVESVESSRRAGVVIVIEWIVSKKKIPALSALGLLLVEEGENLGEIALC